MDETQNIYTLIEYLKKSSFGSFSVGDIHQNHIDIRSNGMNILDLNMFGNDLEYNMLLVEEIVSRLNAIPLLIDEIDRLNEDIKDILDHI